MSFTSVKLKDDPLLKMQGPGMGTNGMLPVLVQYLHNFSPYRGANTQGGQVVANCPSNVEGLTFMQLRCLKRNMPGVTKQQLLATFIVTS